MKTRNQRGREGQTKTHGGEQGNTVEQTQLSGLRVRCQRAERFQSLSNDTSENKPVSIQHSSTEENGALKGLWQENNVSPSSLHRFPVWAAVQLGLNVLFSWLHFPLSLFQPLTLLKCYYLSRRRLKDVYESRIYWNIAFIIYKLTLHRQNIDSRSFNAS